MRLDLRVADLTSRLGLRLRLLLLTLSVAVVAVVVTAWVADRVATDRVQDALLDDEFVEEIIIEEVTFFAATSPDWLDVGEFLEQLADDFETRIALTTPEGVLIADTAARDTTEGSNGETVALPARPLAAIDASNPIGDLFNPCAPFPGESVEDIEIVLEDEEGFPLAVACLAEPAPPALLYLGSADGGGGIALPSGADLRIIAAVLAVLVVVVLLTVVGSQRILRPVAELTAAARRMESGKLDERVVSVGHDEIGQLAQAFNSMAASLEESELERRTLTSDIAHELRTPLSNIRGYLEAIQDGVVEPTAEVVASLHEEALLLQQLVDDLQTLSLAEAGHLRLHLEPVDLAVLATQVVTAYQAQAESAGVTLVAVGTASPRPLDAVRMRQVLGNLIGNALRHTPAGGTITVSVVADGEGLRVAVADSGEGIAPEHLPHLFDRFYRADPSRARATGGSGLGLAIVQKLAQAQGGEASVESTLGQGTTVSVRWPERPE